MNNRKFTDMKKYLMFAGSLLVATMSLQSCLDYDDPGDEMGVGAIMGETTSYIGNVDTIMYHTLPTEEGVKNAIDTIENTAMATIISTKVRPLRAFFIVCTLFRHAKASFL